VLNFIGRLIEGAADTTTSITVTAIISCEFADQADFYYGFIIFAWGSGYITGPIITLMVYNSLGYAGNFFFLACLIALGALIPSICLLPSRLNAIEPKQTSKEDIWWVRA